MTLSDTKKVAVAIMRLLKVRYVSLPIGKTEKGDVQLKFTKDEEDYQIVLDSVPLNMKEYDNGELKRLLEKYLFAQEA